MALTAEAVSTATPLPQTDATVALVSNLGPFAVNVALGDDAVVASMETGIVLHPGQWWPLKIGASATHIAAAADSGAAVDGSVSYLTVALGE